MVSLLAASPAAPSAIEARIAERVAAFAGVMGVAATNLRTGEVIAVGADVRFPTASAIKVPVMVEVFQQLAAGRLRKEQLVTLTDAIKVGGTGVLHDLRNGSQWSVADLLYLMIAVSDNTATNMLVELVGTQAVDDRMVGYGLPLTRLYRPTFRGGKADVYPEEEKEFGLGSSTPREMAHLMELIARGKVVSPEASGEMSALLGRQQMRDMIPRLLPDGDDISVANKPGQDNEKLADANGIVGAVRSDAAIVTTPRGSYVIAIFARRGRDMRFSADNAALVAGAEIARIVHDHFDTP
jgi:beta-lactamase class A